VGRRCLLLGALFAVVVLATGTAVPWFDNSLEYKVKAGCLYNFARFVTWPASAFAKKDDPLVFGILGEDPFGPILEATIDGKTVGGHKVVLRHLSDPAQAAECHMLFVSRSEEQHLGPVLSRLANSHTFCVSEIEDYANEGGVARFYVKSGRVGFEINVDEAARRKLVVSSQLLKLAKVVHNPPGLHGAAARPDKDQP